MNTKTYKSIFEKSPQGFACHKIIHNKKNDSVDYEIIEINPLFEKLIGEKAEKIIGKMSSTVFAKIDKDYTDWNALFKNAADPNNSKSIETYSKVLNKHFKIDTHSPDSLHLVTVFTDITEYKNTVETLKADEEKYRSVLESTLEVIITIDTDGKILYVNSQIEKTYGYKPDEIIGRSFRKFAPKKEIQEYLTIIKELFLDKRANSFISSVYHKDGRIIPVEMSGRVVNTRRKKFAIAVVRDLSERLETEEKLKKSEEQFRMIAENTNDLITLQTFDMNAKYTYVSPAMKDIGGWEPEELIGKSAFKFIHPQDIKKLMPLLKKYVSYKLKNHLPDFEPKILERIEYRAKSKSGEWHYMQSSGSILGNQILFVSRDITEQIQLLESLKKSEEQFRMIAENTNDIISMQTFDMKAKFTYISPSIKEISGYEPSEIIGNSAFKYIHSEDITKLIPLLKKYVANKIKNILSKPDSKQQEIIEYRAKTKSGEWRVMESSGTIIGNQLLFITRDISERVQFKEKLVASEENYRSIFEYANDGIVIIDKSSKIINVNPAFSKITMISKQDVIGKRAITLAKKFLTLEQIPNVLNTIKKIIFNKQVNPFIVHINNKFVEISGSSNFSKRQAIALLRDVTDRKVSERKIKKYAVTQEVLLQEVNHRVKNNLSAIISMIHKERTRSEEIDQTQSLILWNLEKRIKGLATVHNLLSESGWEPIELYELCKQVINGSLKNLHIFGKIKLKINDSSVLINSNQAHSLTLVLNELATNTIKYALANREKGNVNVEIKQDKGMVQIIYHDDGPGYSQDILNEKFNKSGIGFDLIYGIIKQSMGGKVMISNDKGAKTTIEFKNEIKDIKN